MQRLAHDYAETNTGRSALVIPFQSWNIDNGIRRRLFILQIAALILFFMSYANVSESAAAGALLIETHGVRRSGRAALGAPRARQIAQHVTESLLLTGLGCIGAVIVAWCGVRSLLWLYSDSDAARNGDRAGLAARCCQVVFVALCGSVVIGLATAFHERTKDLQKSIHEGGRTIGSRRAAFTRQTLVVFQVACAVTLLAGAGEILQSFWKIVAYGCRH